MNNKDTIHVYWPSIVGALLAVLVCASANAEHVTPDSILRFASGAPGSGLHKHTALIANSLWENSGDHDHPVSVHQLGVAMSSAGSASNLKNLSEGRVEFALARADLARAACASPGQFGLDVSTERIRLVTHLAPALVHIIVRTDTADAPQKLKDLEHRLLSIGLPGDMAQHTLRGLLEAHGVAWQTLEIKHYPVSESYRKLVAGQLDALVIIDQPDSPQLERLLHDKQNRLLGLEPGLIEKFIQQSPFFDSYRVDQNTLLHRSQPVITMAIDMLLLARETVGPESVALVLNHIAGSVTHQHAWRETWSETKDSGYRIKPHPAALEAPRSNLEDEQAVAIHTPNRTELVDDPENQ